jgi:hypothetical protein
MSTVLKYNNVNLKKIMFDEFVMTNSGQYIVSKIWYQSSESDYPKSTHVQIPLLKIDEVTKSDNIVLNTDADITSFFDKIDQMALEFLKKSGVTKTYGLKNVKFVQIVKEINKANELNVNKNVLKLKIMKNISKSNTKFFVMGTRSSSDFVNVRNMLTVNAKIKTIVELDGIVIDIMKNEIFVNVILRQVLIEKVKPLRVDLIEYSFIDSDEENVEPVAAYINDVVLNTNTEYVEEDKVAVPTSDSEADSGRMDDLEKSSLQSEPDSDMSTDTDTD